MNNLDLKNKKVAVLGVGIEGLAVADFLSDNSNKIILLDQKPKDQIENNFDQEGKKLFNYILGQKNIESVFGPDYLDNLSNYDILFRSPGISCLNPKIQEAKESGVKISSQIQLFFDLCPCKIIGVTGTKGKGTTSSIIYEILKKNIQETRNNNQTNSNGQMTNEKMNDQWEMENGKYQNVYLAGNIGIAAISLIPKLTLYDIVILELSSFQLMDLEKSPHIAVITNLTSDHLDYHENIEEYQNAKFNILKYQAKEDFAVLNSESTYSPGTLESINSNIKYFSSNDQNADASVSANEVVLDPTDRKVKICDISEIKLFGKHNLENIVAASLVSDILGVAPEIISSAVKEFNGLPHRLEFVKEINGVKFINDSFATNPAPTMAAIDSFGEEKILILGGSGKGADFSLLGKKIINSNTKSVILIGTEALKIKHSLDGFKGEIIEGKTDISDIVRAAADKAVSGDVVIFSPACASFDMFKNYKDRGDKFRTAVLNLGIMNHKLWF